MPPEIPTDARGRRSGDRWLEPHGGALLVVLGVGLIVAGFASHRSDAFVATLVVFGGLISVLGTVLPRAEGQFSLTATGLRATLRAVGVVSKVLRSEARQSTLDQDIVTALEKVADVLPGAMALAATETEDSVRRLLSGPNGPTGPTGPTRPTRPTTGGT
jgi:hypothetical protein